MHVFVQKITFIRRKIHKKTVATGAALFGSNMHQIVCRLGLLTSGGAYSDPQTTAYSAPPAVFRGLLLRGRGSEGRGGSSSFALGRKKKSRRLCRLLSLVLSAGYRSYFNCLTTGT